MKIHYLKQDDAGAEIDNHIHRTEQTSERVQWIKQNSKYNKSGISLTTQEMVLK